MKIVRVINNNAVLVLDSENTETIALGAGVGYNKKAGHFVNEELVEKLYTLKNVKFSKYEQMLKRTPLIYFHLAEKIMEKAKAELKVVISPQIILALADHLAFAVTRNKQGDDMPNLMIHEVELLYPNEFKVGEYGRTLANVSLDLTLPIDEAGYIALHIVNSCIEDKSVSVNNILILTKQIIDIIEKHHTITVDRDSFDFVRFLAHLKYLATRMFSGNKIKFTGISDMFDLLIQKNKELKKTMIEIKEYINDEFEYELSENEEVYLMLHILRIIS